VLDVALADPEAVKLGTGLNRAYTAALRMGKKGEHTNVLEQARYAAEDYLVHFPPQRRGTILLGALAGMYGKENGGSDTARTERSDVAAWLVGGKEETGQFRPGIEQSSIAQQTIKALRQIDLLPVCSYARISARLIACRFPQRRSLGPIGIINRFIRKSPSPNISSRIPAQPGGCSSNNQKW
jgi:hypothetical protein